MFGWPGGRRTHPRRPNVPVTSRPLDEYCALFGLTRAQLAALPAPLLDCPGGAAGRRPPPPRSR
ncbi:hypothetical protein ACWC9T_10890 [Kitasatospora sp. NPDC001159]